MISAKDAICVKGVESTAGSAILKGYKPLFNATVIKRAIDQGAIIIGKTAQDEFGFGSFNVNTSNPIPQNPHDKESGEELPEAALLWFRAAVHWPVAVFALLHQFLFEQEGAAGYLR